ncbi:MAG: hypothetical protein AAGD38_04795 [Acidobacteriota bacterium]
MFGRWSWCACLIALLGFVAVAPAHSQCSQVEVRLWQPNNEQVWLESDEVVEIGAGEEGHLYLHVEGRSTPYRTNAVIGYAPGTRAGSVARHASLTAQNDEDRRAGRLRFRATAPGTFRLGYQLTGVWSPGRLDAVPVGCRKGVLTVRVVGKGAEGGQVDDDDDHYEEEIEPAAELVALLYEALLRREEAGRIDEGFVRTVRQRRYDGIADVARQITASDEFRRDALRRTEDAHGRARDLADLRELLLEDIYKDLYGYIEPSADEAADDLAALDECLSASRSAQRACEELGANLVRSRLYYDEHFDLIEELGGNSRRRR